MVFLTDRKMENNITNYNNNQLPLIPKVEEAKIYKKNLAPFNIQGKGHQYTNILNKNPGPGSYNLELDIKKPQQNSYSNLNFLSKSPRFNENKNINESPGPGSYNINKKPLIIKKISRRPNSNSLFQYNINSINNISTIPTKKQIFGYIENEDGELMQIINPFHEEYSGEKDNSVGPDRYNILKKEKNPIVDWNRMSERSLIYMKKDNNNKNDTSSISINNESVVETRNISNLDTDISSYIKNIKNKEKNIFEHRIKMKDLINNYKRKINLSHIIIKNKQDIEPIDIESELEFLNCSENKNNKNIFYPLNFNKLRYQKKPEEHQFFGSSVERGIIKLPITDRVLNPGPGTYFKNSFINFKLKNKNKKNPTFSKSERLTSILKKNSSVGPGSYNLINNEITKKSFSNCGSFSFEKRFPDLNNEKSVKNININNNNIYSQDEGNYNFGDLLKKEIKKQYLKKTFVNVEQELKKIMNKKREEKKPDFNNYQKPQIINIIQTKILKKNNYNSDNKPFMSSLGRFSINKNIEEDKNRGPGSYELNKKYEKSFNRKFKTPFNSSQAKNVSYINRTNSFISPAEYQINSYFDWNKKSFNVMFV